MVYMCHIFFIQSIIDGHLGWFQVFAIVNSAVMNIRVQYPYSRLIYSPLDIYPVMRLLRQMEFLFLGPRGIATLSSTMVELIYAPIEDSLFFPIGLCVCLCTSTMMFWL